PSRHPTPDDVWSVLLFHIGDFLIFVSSTYRLGPTLSAWFVLYRCRKQHDLFRLCAGLEQSVSPHQILHRKSPDRLHRYRPVSSYSGIKEPESPASPGIVNE